MKMDEIQADILHSNKVNIAEGMCDKQYILSTVYTSGIQTENNIVVLFGFMCNILFFLFTALENQKSDT